MSLSDSAIRKAARILAAGGVELLGAAEARVGGLGDTTGDMGTAYRAAAAVCDIELIRAAVEAALEDYLRMPPRPDIERRVVLDWLTFGTSLRVDSRTDAQDIESMIRGGLLHAMRARVLSETLADDVERATHTVPATPWAHWKRDHHDARWFRWSPLRWLRSPKTTELTLEVRWRRHATRPYSSLPTGPPLGPVVYQEESQRLSSLWG